jgi:hypothetical protein
MNKPKSLPKEDEVLRRMLASPPDPKKAKKPAKKARTRAKKQ